VSELSRFRGEALTSLTRVATDVCDAQVDGGMLVSSLAASMASVVGGRAELTCAGTALARDASCEEQTADCSLLVVVKSPERLKRSSSSPSLSPGKSGVAGGLEPEAREEAFEAVGKAAKSRNTRKLLEVRARPRLVSFAETCCFAQSPHVPTRPRPRRPATPACWPATRPS